MTYAMILAAGRGERMRPLTDQTPKVLLQAGGKALIEWQLEKLRAAGITDVVINHAWLGSQVEQRLGNGARYGLRIVYSPEQQALESAGGIAQALPLMRNEPFMVVNGDIFLDLEFARLLQILPTLDPQTRIAHLVLTDNPAHHPDGDFVLQDGVVRGDGAGKLTFTGVGLYHPALFSGVTRGDRARLAPLLREAMSRGAVSGEYYGGLWIDVGTPARLSYLNGLLSHRTG